MKNFEVIASVVLYKNTTEQVEKLLASFKVQEIRYFLFLIDNSPEAIFRDHEWPSNIRYQHTGKNLGYGRGHNIAIFDESVTATYHLICNPDVQFETGVLKTLVSFMQNKPETGSLMPDVRYPDGSRQHLVKLIPKPADLFIRRFLPRSFVQRLFGEISDKYLMKDFEIGNNLHVPVLSGCFLFTKRDLLRSVGGFDPRYFLYLEDVDLSRRLYEKAENRFFPEVRIVHEYQKGSYKKPRHLLLHMASAFKYFNKFGWFHDKKREVLNQKAAKQNSPYRKL